MEVYFAGGCFWGVEEFFSRIPGVLDAQSGYANGHLPNPTYEEVCGKRSGHAEAVRVEYDPKVVGLADLTRVYFRIIDPMSINRQGNDIGPQYRTAVFYSDGESLPVLEAVFDEMRGRYGAFMAVKLEALRCFYPAEEYHQDYLRKNPQDYCHVSFKALDELGLIGG